MEEAVNIIEPKNKFTECKFRSIEQEARVIKRCSCQGGNYVDHGYFCNKRQIFKLTPETCESCESFESK
jgi:anaerobic ribonucleoside-triphosphate reductase